MKKQRSRSEFAPTSPEILAFLIAHRVDAAWELENIVVAATARRRGIAQRLLGELIEQVRSTQGSEISLEVRQSNHEARSLYRKAGFEEVGLRKELLLQPSRGCNPLPSKVLIGLSHNEIAPEFGIEPILVLW